MRSEEERTQEPAAGHPGLEATESLQEQTQFDTVRRLLLGPEQDELMRLARSIKRRKSLSAADVGEVLPQSVHHAVRHDAQPLADALFPVLGPALGRAVRRALGDLIQQLNQAAATSLSLRAWSWRMEALRTGRSFGEVALLRSLVYRVEQVFLIHRKAGLLLAHVGVSPVEDTDTVSGMLTAIQDFVNDSFTGEQTSSLDELQAGEHRVLIEQGPHAFMAAVVRGIPPAAMLRERLRAALSETHVDFAAELLDFEGDNIPFTAVRPRLEGCLLEQRSFEPKDASRGKWAVLVIFMAAFAALAWWAGTALSESRRFHHYVEWLAKQPGMVVLKVTERDGQRTVVGMRDPLAADPARLPHPPHVGFAWSPYQSLESPIVLARAKQVLRPPATVTLRLEGTTLVATGSAPHRFLSDIERLGAVIPGVQSVVTGDVVDEDREAVARSRRVLGSLVIPFAMGQSAITEMQGAGLERTVMPLKQLHRAARELGLTVSVTIIGRADPSGSEPVNRRLSQMRADAVMAYLVQRGLPQSLLVAKGVGPVSSLSAAGEVEGVDNTRSVTFESTATESD